MLQEESAQLPSADAEPLGERLDASAVAVERSLGDQRETARHRVRGAAPGAEIGRRFRPATQAGAEACFLRRRRRRVETTILELRGPRPADWPAVDPGRGHADEETAVESSVARLKRPVAGLRVELFHGATMPSIRSRRSRFSDIIDRKQKRPRWPRGLLAERLSSSGFLRGRLTQHVIVELLLLHPEPEMLIV